MPEFSLDEVNVWTWWIIAAVFGILELLAPGIFFIWLAAAAAVVGALVIVVEVPLTVQVALFAVLSVVAVWASRRYLSRHEIQSDHPLLNQRAQSYVGRTFTLDQPIHNGRGKIRIGDTLWLVQGPELPAGTSVQVTGTDGGILTVEGVH